MGHGGAGVRPSPRGNPPVGSASRAAVVYRLQHMYAGKQVGQLQETWLPLALTEGTPLAGVSKVVGGIYRALQDGHAVAFAHAVIAGDRVQLHYGQTFPTTPSR